MVTGSLALVGSGEYLPAMQMLEQRLFDDGVRRGRRPIYVQLATAAGREGEARLEYWRDLGQQQGARMGVEVDFVPVFDRIGAEDPALVSRVADAALIYFSGGDPHHLADSVRAASLWRAVESNFKAGGALAGCSAGAMFLSPWVPSLRFARRVEGIGLLPDLTVIPHFDMIHRWVPDALVRVMTHLGDHDVLIGIDEQTAVFDAGEGWQVWGRGGVHLLTGKTRTFRHAEAVPLPRLGS